MKLNKYAIGAIAGACVLVIGLGAAVLQKPKEHSAIVFDDESNVHNFANYVLIDVDENSEVYKAAKSNFTEFDKHSLNETLKSLAKGYKNNKQYVTLMFNDGTGIYCSTLTTLDDTPSSLIYGKVNEKGNVTYAFGVVDITGVDVIYEPTLISASEESHDIRQYVDPLYISDDFCLGAEDRTIYLRLYGDMPTEEEAKTKATGCIKSIIDNGFAELTSEYDTVYVDVGDLVGLKIDLKTFATSLDTSIIVNKDAVKLVQDKVLTTNDNK